MIRVAQAVPWRVWCILSLVLGVLLAGSVYRGVTKRYVLTLDFPQDRSLGSLTSIAPVRPGVHWFGVSGGSYVDVTMKLPGLPVFREDTAANVWVDSEQGYVQKVMIASSSLTDDQVGERTRQIAAEWKFDTSRVDRWVKRAKVRYSAPGIGISMWTSRSPDGPNVSLSIWQSFNERRPWYIMVIASWPRMAPATDPP